MVAVIPRISSWQLVGKPPVADHCMLDGECSSTAAVLWCVLELPVISLSQKNPWSESGRAVNQDEDPFPTAMSTEFVCPDL